MKQKTFYHIILDQSGSMQDCIGTTISGYNEQVQMIRSLQQRYPEQDILIGLTRFNHDVMHTYFAQNPADVKELTVETFQPDGSTALFDAIGLTVQQLSQINQLDIASGLATTVVVVITDGYENASQVYNLAKIKSMIKELEASGNWTFSFMGATFDAVEVATSMNFKESNSMYFEKSTIKDSFETLGKSMENYVQERSSGKKPTDFLKRKE